MLYFVINILQELHIILSIMVEAISEVFSLIDINPKCRLVLRTRQSIHYMRM